MSQDGRRRPPVDWIVCLVTALITMAGSWSAVVSWLPHLATVPMAAAQGLVLLARRRVPILALCTTAAIGGFMIAVGYGVGNAAFGTCCSAYAVAVYWGGDRRGDRTADLGETLRGAAAVLAAAVVFMVATITPGSRVHQDLWEAFPSGLMVVSAWILGYAIRTRRAYIAELKERAARLEAEEGERADRAVADERLRIARELHDVIGHSISLIAIQSEAATRSVRTNPAAVAGFLATISTTSREALTEMRRVLAVLRPDQEADLTPQPGLDALEELVARLEAGGLTTRLDAERLELPPGIALAVYRIVQESLTNVLKHAGPNAQASVTIARSGASVHVSVHDDGTGPSGATSSAAHGIIGMHERVTLYGGTLRTGARPTGGFEVDAWLPLPEEAQ